MKKFLTKSKKRILIAGLVFILTAAGVTAVILAGGEKGEPKEPQYYEPPTYKYNYEDYTDSEADSGSRMDKPDYDVTVKTGSLHKTVIERQAEYLDRGLVAMQAEEGIFLSWRYLGTDDPDIVFKVYRDGKCITDKALEAKTNYMDKEGSKDSVYYVEALLNESVTDTTRTVVPWADNYFDIPLNKPEPIKMPDGTSCSYTANDASVGDLDGDGQYELILKWNPDNAQDNSKAGYTGNVYIDAYELDGAFLWRIDLGVNIRAGAHYTQFMVYDLDGDGIAELVCKTADGTVDGTGVVIGDGTADYRSDSGYILDGPEYLTLFDGRTGKALDTIAYEPSRGNVKDWGDDYGNRVDRFLAAVAYLEGSRPSVIMCRGYYTRAVLAAYDVKDKKLVTRWIFDSKAEGNNSYAGQGNHNLAVADVDWDGKDEIIYGQCAIDDDGTGLYSTGLGHGDAMHVSDFLPEREGLEMWGCLEASHGAVLVDASTGEILFRVHDTDDTGRAAAGNFVSGNNSAEFASAADNNLYDGNGNSIGTWSEVTLGGQNYAVYWDGDLEQEALDKTFIDKYGKGRIFSAAGVSSNNGTKANTSLTADILGDWREEVIWPLTDSSALRVYTTDCETEYRIFTLMHDTQYRCQVAAQNVAYNQGAYLSFFLGTGYELPKQPQIYAVRAQ